MRNKHKIIGIIIFTLLLPFLSSKADELWEERVNRTQNELEKIENVLEESYRELEEKEKEVKKYEKNLAPLEKEAITLKEQLKNINDEIINTQIKISNIEKQIMERDFNIRKTLENLDRSEAELDAQKKLFLEYAKLLYENEQEFNTLASGQENFIKLLLNSEPISKSLAEKIYLKNIEKIAGKIIYRLDGYFQKFDSEKEKIIDKKEKLENLQTELQQEKDNLEAQKLGQIMLIKETKGKEENFMALLTKANREQEELYFSIENLKGNKSYIASKLKELEENPEKAKESLYEIGKLFEDEDEKLFSWPVLPDRGISAYFLDSKYKTKFGVTHYAIDIVTPQGTPVSAPNNGFVYKVHDGGYEYSYVIIAHRDNFLTLYGHLSKILVKEGELIYKGDIIGLSGGAIGTPGAGVLTTGPHVHFEIFKDGMQVDPLNYLSLDALPTEYIPAKYWKDAKISQ